MLITILADFNCLPLLYTLNHFSLLALIFGCQEGRPARNNLTPANLKGFSMEGLWFFYGRPLGDLTRPEVICSKTGEFNIDRM